MPSELLAQLKDQKFVSLVTYKKDGGKLPTPVWFAEREGKIYVATPKKTYKVRRIQNNPKVQVALCNRSGKEILGDYFGGTATLLHKKENPEIQKLFRKKYGAFYNIWGASVKNLFKKKVNRDPRLIFIEIAVA